MIAIVRWLDDYEKVRVLEWEEPNSLRIAAQGEWAEVRDEGDGEEEQPQMQMALREAEILKDIMEKISHPNIMHIGSISSGIKVLQALCARRAVRAYYPQRLFY